MALQVISTRKILDDLNKNYCVQQSSNLGGASGDGDIVGQEDCLYLDIRAPKNNSPKAVMFGFMGVEILLD